MERATLAGVLALLIVFYPLSYPWAAPCLMLQGMHGSESRSRLAIFRPLPWPPALGNSSELVATCTVPA